MHIFDTKFTRHCPKSRKFTAPDQKTTHHLQQLGDLLRVAGGVGRDAAAEAVDYPIIRPSNRPSAYSGTERTDPAPE